MKKTAVIAVSCIFLALSCAAARAAQDDAAAFGFAKYFQYHPPKDKSPLRNLYPFAGPVIEAGQDIPVCTAARGDAAYSSARGMRYIVHGKDGWLFRTVDFREDFKASPESLTYFSRLSRALAARNQTLVVVFQPPRAMVEFSHVDVADMPKDYSPAKARAGYRDFITQLKDAGVTTVDLSDAPAQQDYFPKGDTHWSSTGAAWSAAQVALAIKRMPAYASLPKQDFDTQAAQIATPARGALEDFVQQACGVNIQATAAPVWTTTAEHPGGAFPAVALLGTTDAAEDTKFDFLGALKKSLGADVYNASITGGGFGSAAERYFASDAYHAHPPKIIIWEFLPQHNYNNPESLAAFRQMLPAIGGACDEKSALAEWSGDLAGRETNILKDAAHAPMKGSYLYIETAAPGTVKTEILYKDGEADEIDMTPPVRASRNGKYYLELGDATLANPLFFHVVTDRAGGRLGARLCRTPVDIAEK